MLMSQDIQESESVGPVLEGNEQLPARRASEEDVRRLVEAFIPGAETRQMVLAYLFELINEVHAIGIERWAITIRDRLRFVAGLYFVLDIERRGIVLALERAALRPDDLPRLQQLTAWDAWQFRGTDRAVTCVVSPNEFTEVAPLVREASIAFVRWAARSAKQAQNGARFAHSAGAIQYLRAELGPDVPEPVFSPTGAASDNLSSVDRSAIESAFHSFDNERRGSPDWQHWEHDATYRYFISWNGQRYPVKEIVRIASGVTQFNSDRARRLLARLSFTVETLQSTAQNVWLFQANPKFYDLAERVPQAHIGDEDTWTVTRHRDEMRPGDTVLLWLSGPNAGIYAIGELTGVPAEQRYQPGDENRPAWLETEPTEAMSVWRVPFRYTRILPEPIRKATLLEHGVLQRLLVLRAPSGTNFRVGTEEWIALQDVLDRVPPPKPDRRINSTYSLTDCAAETGVSEAELARWLRALQRKKQAVLYGPPGTGKTFIAQRLARHLIGGGDGFMELVQFHPAYTYEDFIQGIRPASEGGTLTYPLVPGRFLDFCARARAVADPCALIIDEINRANLARVFGELMYLLEYRDQSLPLASGGLLSIPENVRIIGTMNTADRSIALVDHALRRRFAFLPLEPNYDVLRRFQQMYDNSVEELVGVLEQVNHEIGDPSYAVGISFFMRQELADELEDIWRMEIEPYLEEYFFDRREVFERFRWERIAARVQP